MRPSFVSTLKPPLESRVTRAKLSISVRYSAPEAQYAASMEVKSAPGLSPLARIKRCPSRQRRSARSKLIRPGTPSCATVLVQRWMVDKPFRLHPKPTEAFEPLLEYVNDNCGCIPAVPGGTASGIAYVAAPSLPTESAPGKEPASWLVKCGGVIATGIGVPSLAASLATTVVDAETANCWPLPS